MSSASRSATTVTRATAARRAIRDEPTQRFTHRGAAHAQALGLFDLAEYETGRERARLDVIEQSRVRAITRGGAFHGEGHTLSVYINRD